MIVDGKVITNVVRTCWKPDDDRRMRGAVLVGRATVELDGRDEIDGLVFASTDQRTLGARFVVFFEPWSSRLMAVDLPDTTCVTRVAEVPA